MLKSKWARATVLSAMACVVPVLAAAKSNVVRHHVIAKPLAAVHHTAVKTMVKSKRVTRLTKGVHKLHTLKVAHRSLSTVRPTHRAMVSRSTAKLK